MRSNSLAAVLLFVLATFASQTSWTAALPSCKDQWIGYRIGVDSSYAAYSKRFKRMGCIKDWTVLVYMAANNDLEPYGLWDLYEMEAAFATPELAGSTRVSDLVVHLESPGQPDSRRIHLFQSQEVFKPRNLNDFKGASPDSVKSPVVQRLPNLASESQAARLQNFLTWGVKQYPSKNYLVIVWGHGQGWTVEKPKNPLTAGKILSSKDVDLGLPLSSPHTSHLGKWGGLAFNHSDGSYLDIPSLNRVLESMKRQIGRPIDVYASDACLMQMLEVSTELASNARFVTGSTQIQSFQGLPYRRLMWELNRGGFAGEKTRHQGSAAASDEAFLMARMLPKIMKSSMDPHGGSQGRSDPQGYRTLLMGSLNSQETGQLLLPALDVLGTSIIHYLAEDPLRKIDLQFLIQNTPALEGNAQDLGIFLGLMDMMVFQESQRSENNGTPASRALKQAIDQSKNALNRSIVNYVYGTAYGVDQTSRWADFVPRAISVWLPGTPEDYQARIADFSKSKFYKSTPNWGQWLKALYTN